ncbi:MAG: lipoate--protein ligase family protein [Acidimicrobiales bacterium]
MSQRRWAITHVQGRAGQLHAEAADLLRGPGPAQRGVRAVELTVPAVVLGSSQPGTHVDERAARAAGVDVARRRSGGAAVLVDGALVWVDLVIPAADPAWSDDVGRAAWWVGEAWCGALGALGVVGAEVWRGPMRRPPWAQWVCFAGLGPGEVMVAGRKVVGVAQRRNRLGALFQCAVLLDWDPAALLGVLRLDDAERRRAAAALAGVATGLGRRVGPEALLDALVFQLERAGAAGP